MALHFFPRVVKFFELFKHQNDILAGCAGVLDDLFDTYTTVSEKCNKIVQFELKGNDVSREIARQLSLTFITPLDREDIFSINMAHENLLNSLRAISTRIGLYKFSEIRPGAREVVQKLRMMIEETSPMIPALNHRKDVSEHIRKILEVKHEADMLLLVSLGEVYEGKIENNGDLLEMIKWSHIYDRIEVAIANAEVLANIIEGVSLKNA